MNKGLIIMLFWVLLMALSLLLLGILSFQANLTTTSLLLLLKGTSLWLLRNHRILSPLSFWLLLGKLMMMMV